MIVTREHLPDDDLDVLVVDRHTLAAVDLLHLADQVLLHLARARMRSTFFGSTAPSISCSPDLDVVAFARPQARTPLRPVRDLVAAVVGDDDDLARACSVSSMRTRPAASLIGATPLGVRASKSSTTRGRPWVMSSPATPPVWKVRIVSCVPGSPIDWAAMMPTASPTSTSLPVASERP